MIELRDLSRTFGDRVAVDGLSLDVRAGEIVSLLGPNGAGKTTTFRLVAALLPASAGTIVVGGIRLTPGSAAAVRGSVGLLTEAPGLWDRLSVRWTLRTYARLYGAPDDDSRLEAVMETVGLRDRADERTGSLSKGLRQRAAIARALIHDPPVVLLDEPTSGLDPESARHVRDVITRLRTERRAVLISTHHLGEAEALSDRIAVLSTRLLACDTPQRLRERRRSGTVLVELADDANRFREAAASAGANVEHVDARRLEVRVGDAGQVPDLVAALVRAGARITRVEPRDASLEDVYLALVRESEPERRA